MIPRYSRPEMAALWSDEAKFQRWLEVEVAACDAWAELGQIPAEAAAKIREKARFDLAKVNVHFTSKGVKEPLGYDVACTAGKKGWRFDSLDKPTKIELCTTTCDTFEKDPDGVLGVEFGCQRTDIDQIK